MSSKVMCLVALAAPSPWSTASAQAPTRFGGPSLASLFDQGVERFGSIDIPMNNAGVDASGKDVADLPTDVWDTAMRTNLYGTFFWRRRFVQLRKQAEDGGKIIDVTSVHEDRPWPPATPTT
ncbi:MAG: SDR family oxidoreductase [Acidimicrobiia bacterium]|nr:SDR family oxidoreductase [Acidimicrobiia bacterium]